MLIFNDDHGLVGRAGWKKLCSADLLIAGGDKGCRAMHLVRQFPLRMDG
jgi:hypothetical protein